MESRRKQRDVIRAAQATRAQANVKFGASGGLFSSIALQAGNTISGQRAEDLTESEQNQFITEEVFARNFAALDFRRNASDFNTAGNRQQLNISNARASQSFGQSLVGAGLGLASSATTFGRVFGPSAPTSTQQSTISGPQQRII